MLKRVSVDFESSKSPEEGGLGASAGPYTVGSTVGATLPGSEALVVTL